MVMRWMKFIFVGMVATFAGIQLAAAEPSVAGLWQRTDETTGKPVIWFLFVENHGTYQGVAAKLFPARGRRPAIAGMHSVHR